MCTLENVDYRLHLLVLCKREINPQEFSKIDNAIRIIGNGYERAAIHDG